MTTGKEKTAGPAGLVDWEAQFPRLFAMHGGPVDLATVVKAAPEVVRELVDLVEHYPLRLIKVGGVVSVEETDKAAAAEHMEAINRCVEIINGHQAELVEWLASLIA